MDSDYVKGRLHEVMHRGSRKADRGSARRGGRRSSSPSSGRSPDDEVEMIDCNSAIRNWRVSGVSAVYAP